MESKELRIGNLVWGVSDRIEVISEIQRDKIETVFRGHLYNYCTIDDIAPIDISPEILLKAGFEISKSSFLWFTFVKYYKSQVAFSQDLKKVFIFNEFINQTIEVNTKIEYLHQLQNLYWCLCNKELEINLQ